MVACSAYACLIIYFIISAGGYNDDFHNTVLKFQFIYDTDSIFQKRNLKATENYLIAALLLILIKLSYLRLKLLWKNRTVKESARSIQCYAKHNY